MTNRRVFQGLCRMARTARPRGTTTLSPCSTFSQPMLRTAARVSRPGPFPAALRLLRPFSTTHSRSHGHIDPPKPGEEVWVTFVDKDGSELKIAAKEGDNLLDLAQANDIDLEGACGGSCACSTCHLIVRDQDVYDRLPEPEDDELDMLELAFGATLTSRLGCQIKMNKDIDGIVVNIPAITRNLQKKDFEDK